MAQILGVRTVTLRVVDRAAGGARPAALPGGAPPRQLPRAGRPPRPAAAGGLALAAGVPRRAGGAGGGQLAARVGASTATHAAVWWSRSRVSQRGVYTIRAKA